MVLVSAKTILMELQQIKKGRGSMYKILIAEDNKGVRHLIARIIRTMEGMFTIECSNGQRAMDILEDNHDIDILITDIQMPEMDGFEVIRRVRAQKSTQDLPIIVISGVIRVAQIRDLLDMGASRFLPKPIPGRSLKEYLLNLLDID